MTPTTLLRISAAIVALATALVRGNDGKLLEAGSGKITALAYTPDGKFLAAGALDQNAWLWNLATGEPREFRAQRRGAGFSVAVSPDCGLLAVADFDLSVRLYSLPSGKEVASLPTGAKSGWTARRVAFSPDGKFLVGGRDDGAIQVWDVAQRKEVKGVPPGSSEAAALAFSPDGATLVVASHRRLRLLEFADRSQRAAIEAPWPRPRRKHGESPTGLESDDVDVQSAAFSPNGKLLATGESDGKIRFRNPVDGKTVKVVPIMRSAVEAVAFSPDGALLACPGESWNVLLIDVASGKPVSSLGGFPESVRAVAFSPDGKTIAAASHLQIHLKPVAGALPYKRN